MCENNAKYKKLCSYESCKYCYNRSFASHPKAKFWDHIGNILTPRQIYKCTPKKYWFNCKKCNHSFDVSPNNMSKGRWCPYCSVPCHKLCTDNNCNFCFNNSFAKHPKAQFWNYEKNSISPRQVTAVSGNRYWFNCDKCLHTFDCKVSNVVNKRWCSYCGHSRLCDDEFCMPCYNSSFTSHYRSLNWDFSKNDNDPRDVFLHSGNKYWFLCNSGHSFYSIICDVANDQWCPFCQRSKGEEEIVAILKQKGIEFTEQKTFDDLISEKGWKLKYDIYFERNEKEFIIEFDGEQHFNDRGRFGEFLDERKLVDLKKTKYCVDNNINILRISHNCLSRKTNNIKIWIDKFLELECHIFSDEDLYKDHIALTL